MEPEARRMPFSAVVWAVLLTALVTAGLVALGPAPRPAEGLFDAGDGLRELRDRWWYVGWLLLPPALLAFLGTGSRGAWLRGPRGLAVGVAVLALGALGLLTHLGPCAWPYPWHGFGGPAIAGRLLAAWGLERWGGRPRVALALGALGGLLVARAASFVWLDPAHVPYPLHFAFVADELLAPAAGRPPLGGYVPTYTALLGWPPVPLIVGLGLEPVGVVCAYLWALTLATLGLVLAALVRLGGWRHLGLYALVVGGMPLMHDACTPEAGLHLASYLPVWPVRLVVPAASLGLLAAWRSRAEPGARGAAGLGALAALAVLCNVDFGAVDLVASLACVALFAWQARRPGWLGAFLGAAGLVWGSWLLLHAWSFGRLPDWAGPLKFLRLFAEQGFLNVAMAPLGLHTVAAGFAALCLWAAVPAILRGVRDARLDALAFAALFALGTLAYFTGRSLDAVLAVGSGLPLATCAALWATVRAERPGWPLEGDGGGLPGRLLGLLPVATLVASLASHPTSWQPPQQGPYPRREAPPLPATLPAGTATFARDGNLWTLRWGLRNSLQLDHPFHLVGPAWADCWCEDLARATPPALWV
ncbi:MAG: hypothetical protein VKS61_13290 [Candidatus Sericytochromatia bacterium]|nr:hypothetical protein [Candidatus Sericytochromatia bacterium]